MFSYQKKLQYPINIKNKDLEFAKNLLAQYGGPNGELGAALQYLNQRYTMPDGRGQALLTDIGVEELGHVEMIATMFYQLIDGATIEQLKKAGLSNHYTEHAFAPFPSNGNGNSFTADYIATTGDYLADLESDMAAEQKARATYEHLINLTNDNDIIAPLSFLRQREIVHYNLFKELRDYYITNEKNL
ncbi:MAG: manganese catalase family protein [Bacilli bacterium]|nr:manganese catalase family protein [Bacilli bacterium]